MIGRAPDTLGEWREQYFMMAGLGDEKHSYLSSAIVLVRLDS